MSPRAWLPGANVNAHKLASICHDVSRREFWTILVPRAMRDSPVGSYTYITACSDRTARPGTRLTLSTS
eukprot:scaffold414790_cov59-Attheya_sp.AAC.2